MRTALKLLLLLCLNISRPCLADLPIVGRLNGNDQFVTTMAVNTTEQNIVIVGDQTKKILVWDMATRKIIWQKTLPEKPFATAFSADGRSVAVGGRYQMLHLYDVLSGNLLAAAEKSRQRHRSVHQILNFSPDSTRILSIATMGDTISAPTVHFPEKFSSVRKKMRERCSQKMMLWDAETGKLSLDHILNPDSYIFKGQFALEEEVFYTVSYTNIKIYRTATAEIIRQFSIDQISPRAEHPVFLAAAFEPTMRYLAVSTLEGILIVSTESGKVLRRFLVPNSDRRPEYLQFSDDMETLYGVFGGADPRVMAWNFVEEEVVFDQAFVTQAERPLAPENMIINSGQGPMIKILPELNLLIHAYPGEFSGGSIISGGTGLILRRLELPHLGR